MLIDPLTTFCKKSLWMLHKTAGSRRQKLEDIWWNKGYELPSSIEKAYVSEKVSVSAEH